MNRLSILSPLSWVISFGERLIVLTFMIGIWIVSRLLCKVTVSGRKNISRSGRVLYLMRHRSGFGIFLLEAELLTPWVLWRMAMFPYNVAKQKHVIRSGKILRWLANHFRVLELPEKSQVPGGRRSEIVKSQIDALTGSQDAMMVLFPTGTRDDAAETEIKPFLPGVGRVVAESLPQVIFVWDDDTAKLWPKGRKWPDFKVRYAQIGTVRIPVGWYRWPVTITISKPLDASDPETQLAYLCRNLPPAESGSLVADYLHELFAAWVETECRQLELDLGKLKVGVAADLKIISF